MKKRLSETKNIRNTSLRLNMDIPIQQKAWAYLQEMDKKIFKSYSSIVANAVVEYYDKYKKMQEEESSENREYQFLQQIQNIIRKEVRETIERIITIEEPNLKIIPIQEAKFQNKMKSIQIEQEINDTALDFIEGFSREE